MGKTGAALLLSLVLAMATSGMAEVVDSAAGGFTVRTTLNIQAPAGDVYRGLLQVGNWWNPQHTFSGDAHNLSMEEKVTGCFCERLPGGGGARHMEIIFLAPGKRVVFRGGLGPLMTLPVAATMEVQITPAGPGATLALTYRVGGYAPAGLNTWASPVDQVLGEQFGRLKNYVEHGDPGDKK